MAWPFTIFVTVFLAELPDKTSLVSLTMISHYRAWLVWVGASLALIAQTFVALIAGRLMALVPHRPLTALEAALFLGLALWLWKGSGEESSNSSSNQIPVPKIRGNVAAILQIFGVVLVGEFLDLTQLATMAFAARHAQALWLVGISAAAGLLLANGLVVSVGHMVLRRISGLIVQRVAAVIFAVIAATLFLSLWHVRIV